MPVVCCSDQHEVDHRGQHQDAAERGVEHELERRVDAPLAAPDADDAGTSGSASPPRTGRTGTGPARRTCRASRTGRGTPSRRRASRPCVIAVNAPATTSGPRNAVSSDQQHVVAVEPDLVVHAPVGDPRQARLELQAGRRCCRSARRARRRERAARPSRPARAGARDRVAAGAAIEQRRCRAAAGTGRG